MRKILLIDDDLQILNVVKLALSYHHYKVKAIRKWQTIIKDIKVFEPDIIMLDIDLEGADGSEICRKLKARKATKDIPVILISGFTMSDSYIKESKAQGFIAKPFDINELLVEIRNNLN